MEMNIKIKYLEGAKKLEKITKGDWIDVYAYEDVFIPNGEMKLINLGFAMELPEGYEAHLVPRSSTYKNWGIIMTNSIGIIDNSYCGDNDIWKFPAYSLSGQSPAFFKVEDERFSKYRGKRGSMIHKGDKIAQFRIVEKMPEIEFEEVEQLGNSDRGGFGSTGNK